MSISPSSSSSSFSAMSSAAEYHRRQAAIPIIDFSQQRFDKGRGLAGTPYSSSRFSQSPMSMCFDSSSEFSVESPTPAARSVIQIGVPLDPGVARTPYSPSPFSQTSMSASSENSSEFSIETPTPATRNGVPLDHRRVMTPLSSNRCKNPTLREHSRPFLNTTNSSSSFSSSFQGHQSL
jgi:hypothetical protein